MFNKFLPHIDLGTDMDYTDDKPNQVLVEMSHWHNEKLSLEHSITRSHSRFSLAKETSNLWLIQLPILQVLQNRPAKISIQKLLSCNKTMLLQHTHPKYIWQH